MRTVRSVPCAVDNLYYTAINRCIERARETGTVMVRDICRILDIDIISTVTAVPLLGILIVVFDF